MFTIPFDLSTFKNVFDPSLTTKFDHSSLKRQKIQIFTKEKKKKKRIIDKNNKFLKNKLTNKFDLK